MGKQTFLKGAFILVLASVLVKAMGFLYQVVIVRLMGTEGIGIFNMVYPLYITALVLTTAGIPLAIAKFVAEEVAREKQVMAEELLGMAIAILMITSTLGALFLIIASPYLIRYLYADPRVIPSFLIIVPTLLLVAVSSPIKAYFQGMQDMRPTAFTQLIEQIIRFICGIALVYFLYPYGLTWASVGLAGGILLSEVGGLVYLWRLYRKTFNTSKLIIRPSLTVLRKLFSFSIPVTFTRIIITLVAAAEASLIPRVLIKSGLTLSEATSFFGELTGVAFTLLTIPSTLSYSLATTLVPAIADAQSKKHKSVLAQRTSDALGITLLAGVPCALILFFWGQHLTGLLFKAHNAGFLLQILSVGSVFLYLSQTTSGILQGTGYVMTSFTTTVIAGMVRLSGIYFLGSSSVTGIAGIAFSYVGSFLISAILNLSVIKIITRFSLDGLFYLRLLLSGLVLAKLLDLFNPLVQSSTVALVILTLLLLLLFIILLLVTGDKYAQLILQQFFRSSRAG